MTFMGRNQECCEKLHSSHRVSTQRDTCSTVHTGSPHGEIPFHQFTQGLHMESYLLHSSHRVSTRRATFSTVHIVSTERTSSSKVATVSPACRNTLFQIDIFIKKPWYNFQNQMLPEIKENHKDRLQRT